MTLIWLAHAEEAVGRYDIDAIGHSQAQALTVLLAALRAERANGLLNRRWLEALGDGTWLQSINMTALEVGRAYFDLGSAGEAGGRNGDSGVVRKGEV